jgi:hypothetical protein
MSPTEQDLYKWARLAHVCILGQWSYAAAIWTYRLAGQCPFTERQVVAHAKGATKDEVMADLLSSSTLLAVLTDPEVKRKLDLIG